MHKSASSFLVMAALAMGAGPLAAQETTGKNDAAQQEGPAVVTAQTLEDLVATLEDPGRRAQLIDDLRALLAVRGRAEVAPAAGAATGLIGRLVELLGGLSGELRNATVALAEQLALLPERAVAFWDRLQEPDARRAFLAGAATVLGVLLVALLAVLAVWWPLRRPRLALSQAALVPAAGPLARVARLLARAVLDILPPIVLLVVALAGVALTAPAPAARAITLAVAWALALKSILVALFQILLASDAPRLRLFALRDETVHTLDSWVRRLAILGVYGYFLLECLLALETDSALVDPLRRLYGLLLMFALIVFVMKQRGAMRDYLAARVAKAAEGGKAWRSMFYSFLNLWWLAAILYVVGLYLVWAGGMEEGLVFVVRATAFTALSLIAGILAAALIRGAIRRIVAASQPMRARYPELEGSAARYEAGLRFVARLIIVTFVICFALEAWDVKALALLAAEPTQRLISALLGILVIVLAAAAVIDLATVITQRYLESRERTGKATAKTRTVLPLARKAIKLVVVVIAVIMSLSQAGVQVAPLLAGVGVIGLAVGFGAQTLVKDVITGFFILLEDTIAVGDVAVLNGIGGQVEAINIRTVQLRDLSGNVHTIPYSSIGAVTNMTKEYSRYLIEAGVAYREDVDEVIELLKQIGAEMQKDPVFGPDILEPIEILGLDRFEDSAVIVRARLKTRPIKQWSVGREFNRRMKQAFDEGGIEIPFPHRTIYWGALKDGSQPPLKVQQGGEGSAT
ncbi:MAG: mechanosensitive ion channel domain-containing protein [Planctomycetota bacterium]